jgi:hypothetical protein
VTPGGVRARSDAPLVAAALPALLVLASCLLVVAAGPLVTDDLWWHLAIGEVYAQQGPWPDGDPLLHTAHADAPVQHEWLFGVAVHAVQRASGFFGLRVAHGLLVAGILALAFRLCRREGGSLLAGCFGASVFVVLAWWRLFQLRPDLASIPAALALWPLLLRSETPPSWTRVAAFAGLCALWANLHSLFLVGLLLLAAGLAGMPLRAALARRLPAAERAAEATGAARARRLAAALALGLAASALNPRGFAQHLTFLTSSREAGIWRVHDEWTPFHPFSLDYTTAAVSLLSWLVTDALLLGFAICAALALAGFWRAPDRRRLAACDPVLLALGCAGAVALLVSVRFLWLGIFPLLFVLRALRVLAAGGAARRAVPLALAAASVALAAAFPFATAWREVRGLQPADPRAWLSTPFVADKYHPQGVRFLLETGLEGNLFNKYPMGGFLEFWLAPRLRAFVDGRTEHYPSEVLAEYSALNLLRGTRPGESFVELLERRRVDIFFGTGPPSGIWRDAVLYTAEHLSGVQGWLLVERAADHAIYLRDDARNRENLARVAAWYQHQGVPFDAQRGLDVARVVDERPDWAVANRMLPRGWDELVARAEAGDFAALDAVGRSLALLGLYARALEVDARALALRPEAKAPRRRQVYALLRLGRVEEARARAAALLALDPADPGSRAAARVARLYAERIGAGGGARASGGPVAAPEAPLAQFPLLDDAERREVALALVQPRLPGAGAGW